MTRLRLAAVTVATLGLVAAGVAPASAERIHPRDAAKDVVAFSMSGPESGYTPVPTNKNADVTRTVMRHSPNRVIVRSHFRDLNSRSGYAAYFIRTDDGTYQAMQVLGKGGAGPLVARSMGMARGVAPDEGADEHLQLMGPEGIVECDDMWSYSRKGEDRARVSIARSCLGNPTWVRLGAGFVGMHGTEEAPVMVGDDALRKGLTMEGSGLTLTRRLHHP